MNADLFQQPSLACISAYKRLVVNRPKLTRALGKTLRKNIACCARRQFLWSRLVRCMHDVPIMESRRMPTTHEQRETLLCLGGPLNRVRLSVPFGLKWFTLEMIDTDDLNPGNCILQFESIAHISDFSTTSEWEGSSSQVEQILAYVRTSFVTGEHGLIHVFSFRET